MNTIYFDIRQQCPACAATGGKIIYQSPYDRSPVKDYLLEYYSTQGRIELEYLENNSYVLEECTVCRLIYQKEIPNDQLMERLYDYWLDPKGRYEYHIKNDGLSHFLNYAQEITRVIAYLNKSPNEIKIFDFGMGWGKWALMAKAFGCDAYGSELSTERINNAKLNGLKVIHWDDFDKYQFHFINTEQVFEHIPKPLETLCHLKKALAKDGVIKISVPTANNIEYRLKKMDWKAKKNSRNSLNPVAPLEHINFFRRKSLVKMAEKAGLKEVSIPISKQYQYTSDWGSVKKIAKNLFQPISLNILRSHNYLLFKQAEE